ncbi:MAG: TlyA family RNA methyltransferase [Clostridia bacterium]|nr:TlyA family RNA methyltransferase [Clostridia bacterium]
MKKRLDIIMCEKKIAPSREKAKELILDGLVFVGDKKINKPSAEFEEDVNIKIEENAIKYVSRGGIKLEKALNNFDVEVIGRIALDVGASTGGFTDCMLQNGCKKVYAVDVGHGQLNEKLLNDPRVENIEGVNARRLKKELFKDKIDFFTVDVSFISLTLILSSIRNIVENGALGICLIKPQFEVGKGNVDKSGVVKDKKLHAMAVNKVCDFCLNNGFAVLALDYSPIKGPDGNIEYLMLVKKSWSPYIDEPVDPENIVELSHDEL